MLYITSNLLTIFNFNNNISNRNFYKSNNYSNYNNSNNNSSNSSSNNNNKILKQLSFRFNQFNKN